MRRTTEIWLWLQRRSLMTCAQRGLLSSSAIAAIWAANASAQPFAGGMPAHAPSRLTEVSRQATSDRPSPQVDRRESAWQDGVAKKGPCMKLDVGCGRHKLPDAVGIDWKAYPGVDVVQDLNQAPWPLADSTFDYLRCQHVIEHIRNLPVLVREMHRVAKDGAEVEFRTPHYSSWTSWGDPTHCHHFGLTSIPQLLEMELPPDGYEIIENELKFTGSVIDFFGWLTYKLSPRKYEKYFTWQLPAHEIVCRVRFRKRGADGRTDGDARHG